MPRAVEDGVEGVEGGEERDVGASLLDGMGWSRTRPNKMAVPVMTERGRRALSWRPL
jgi:hypothetical protein